MGEWSDGGVEWWMGEWSGGWVSGVVDGGVE